MDSASSEYSSSLLDSSLDVSGATDEDRTFKLPLDKKNKQCINHLGQWQRYNGKLSQIKIKRIS